MGELNLLSSYPRSKRPIEERARLMTAGIREVARLFGREYFDGDRLQGYGGYRYDNRWKPIAKQIADYYQLREGASVLDVGCAKGYLLHDFKDYLPHLTIAGIDISEYAIENAMETVKPFLRVGNAKELPYEDDSFDLVISINTIHNLPLEECKQALREIQRVTRKDAFITVDAWRTEEERKRLIKWNLTALTFMHVEDWKRLFEETGYTGDYYWFIAE